MAEPIKITEEELESFNHMKLEIQKNIFDFGELYLQKIELDNLYRELASKEQTLKEHIAKLKQSESELMNRILQKYGEGSLNVKDGIFTPS